MRLCVVDFLKSSRARIGPACSSLLESLLESSNGVLVPVPLVPGCSVGGVDRREVVQVPTIIIFCPPMNFVRVSILLIKSWLFFFAHLWASFPMVFLPLSFSVSFFLLSNSLVHGSKEQSSPQAGF